MEEKSNDYKYFLWYVYGFGNAERLCKIVDDVVNEHKRNGDDKDEKFGVGLAGMLSQAGRWQLPREDS